MKKVILCLLVMIMILTMGIGLLGCGASDSEKEDGKDEISSGKVLRVGMECAYAPFNWTQPDDSNGAVSISGTNDYANGYDIMVAKKIAEAHGSRTGGL